MQAKRVLLTLIFIGFFMPLVAQTVITYNGLRYSLNTNPNVATVISADDTPIVMNAKRYSGPLAIPETIPYLSVDYKVTAIGDYAFYHCVGLTGSLTIPSSVTSIGSRAFDGCSGFKGSLTIPSSVTTIGSSAFYYCNGFTGSLTIPVSVTFIGDGAFDYCSGFKGSLEFTTPSSLTSIGSRVFASCHGMTGSITIPSSVTSIGHEAFISCVGFNGSLTIPSSVTSIGDEAFFACSNLTGSLTIPSSVTSINTSTFGNCVGFNGSLIIPSSVTSIGIGAFSNCNRFTGSLTIPASVTTIGTAAFYNCSGFNGSLEFTVPSSTASIGSQAFDGCSGFTGSLIIPSSVKTIGFSAFEYCPNLTKVTISNSLTTIGANVFSGTNKLSVCEFTSSTPLGFDNTNGTNLGFNACTKIIVPTTAAVVDYKNAAGYTDYASQIYPASDAQMVFIPAFAPAVTSGSPYNYTGTVNRNGNSCVRYTASGVPTGWTFTDNSTNPAGGFTISGPAPTQSFTIIITPTEKISDISSAPVTQTISYIAGCTFPQVIGGINYSLNADGTLTVIRPPNFGEYTGQITIPDKVVCGGITYNVTKIGDDAFKGFVNITGSLTIPSSVTTIGVNAFYQCTGLNGSLTFTNPSSLTTIGTSAFYGCNGLTGLLTIPSSVTSIGKEAFRDCQRLTGSLTIPSSVTSIGDNAFTSCTGLNGSLIFTNPSSLTTIGSGVFSYCSGFKGSLTIPSSVTSIGDAAFDHCSGFTGSLTIPSSVTLIGADAFSNCYGFTGSLTIPSSIIYIQPYVFRNCSGFTGSLTIPSKVTYIGHYAFSGCSGFTGSLTIPSSVKTIKDYSFGLAGVSKVTIPSSLTSISIQVFGGTDKLTVCEFLGATPPAYQHSGLYDESYQNLGFNNCTKIIVPTTVDVVTYQYAPGFKGFYENQIYPANDTVLAFAANAPLVKVDSAYSYAGKVNRNGSSCVTYRASGFPASWAFVSNVTSAGGFTLTGDAPTQSFYGTITATEAISGVEVSQPISFVSPPAFTSTHKTSATVKQPYSYTIATQDLDKETLTISVVGTLPTGLTLESTVNDLTLGTATAVLSGSIATAGSYPVTLMVTDAKGASTPTSFTIVVEAPNRVYVNSSVTASSDGTSWSTAVKTIEEAVAMIASGGEIWIAQGSYTTPMSVDNLSRLPYNLTKSVSFYGGFAGSESSVSERALSGSETVITSSFNQTLYNTFEVTASSLSFVFDKLTITDCRRVVYSNSLQKSNSYTLNNLSVRQVKEVSGKGILEIDEGAQVRFVLTGCNFANNDGSLYLANSKNLESGNYRATITDCQFTENPKQFVYLIGVDSVNIGGCNFLNESPLNSVPDYKLDAIHIQKAVSVEMKNSTFLSLSVKDFVVTFFSIKNLVLDGCTFSKSLIAQTSLKGSLFVFSNVATVLVKNCLITENNLGNNYYLIGTDALSTTRRNINLENCTLSNNTSAGICNVKAGSIVLADFFTIRNSILWNNTFAAAQPIGLKATVSINNSSIQNELQQYVDTVINKTNIFTNPQLTPTYSLSCTSPCINRGINPSNFSSLTDLAGNARVQNGTIDMGAYESSYLPFVTPVASFSASAAQLGFNETILFTNTTANKELFSFKWFVDSVETPAEATGNLSLKFTTSGVHKVKLVAQGSCEVQDVTESSYSIALPEPSFTFNSNQLCLNTDINLANTTLNKEALSFVWKLGLEVLPNDGLGNSSVKFATPGLRVVSLTAMDAAGNNATHNEILNIDQDTVSFIATNNTPCLGNLVTYTNTSAGLARGFSYSWYVNDVLLSTGANLSHTFAAVGDYTVKLVSKNNNCLTELIVSKTINVAKLDANLQVVTPNPMVGYMVEISNTTLDKSNLSFNWLVDGTPVTSPDANKLNYIFSLPGNHKVSLKATTPCGEIVQKDVEFVVVPAPLSIVMDVKKPCFNADVLLSTDPIHATGYELHWKINGTDVSTSATHSFKVSSYRLYTIVLTAKDALNNIQTVTHNFTITNPQPSFVFQNTLFCANQSVTAINNTANPDSLSFKWLVNDAVVSTAKDFSYTPVSDGSYRVKLSSTNECGAEMVVSNDFVVDKVFTTFTSSANNVYPNVSLQFTNTTSAIGYSYVWDFGDATQPGSFTNSVSHSYQNAGVYQVKLTGTNACGTSYTAIQNITIKPFEKLVITPTIPTYATDVYYFSTTAACGNYNWSVTDGRIILGAGTSRIGVIWKKEAFTNGAKVNLTVTDCGNLIYENGLHSVTFNNVPCFVDNTNDDGVGSFRQAIECANTSGSYKVIKFILDGSGPHYFNLKSNLPDITRDIVVDGFSQYGNYNGDQLVLKGNSSSNTALTLNGSGALITGLKIRGYNKGVHLKNNVKSGNIYKVIFDSIVSGAIVHDGNLDKDTLIVSNCSVSNAKIGLLTNGSISGLNINNNTFANCDTAVSLAGLCNKTKLSYNTISKNTAVGIYVNSIKDTLIINNNGIGFNSGKGVEVKGSKGLALLSNIITGSKGAEDIGILLNGGTKSTIALNTVKDVKWGCKVVNCTNIKIDRNHFDSIAGNSIELEKSNHILITKNTTKGLAKVTKPINLNIGTVNESNEKKAVPTIQYATYKNGKIVMRGTSNEQGGVLEFFLTDTLGVDLLTYVGDTKIDRFGKFTFEYPVANVLDVNDYNFKATIRDLSYSKYDVDTARTSEATAAFNPQLTTCYVTRTDDKIEKGTLRYNILLADSGKCTLMQFALQGGNLIQPLTDLPEITAAVLTIDATSQTGYVKFRNQVELVSPSSVNSAFRVNSDGLVAIHGFKLSNYKTPIVVDKVNEFEASENNINNFTGNPFEINSTNHEIIRILDNSITSNATSVGFTINKPLVNVFYNTITAGSDTAVVVKANGVEFVSNTIIHPNANESAGSCAISVWGITDSASVSTNRIDGYDLGMKLNKSSGVRLYRNVINKVEHDKAIKKEQKLKKYGIVVTNALDSNAIIGNEIYLTDTAIVMKHSPKLSILSSRIDSCRGIGIFVDSCNKAIVNFNTISRTHTGIELSKSSNTLLNGNQIVFHQFAGVLVQRGSDANGIHKNYIGDYYDGGLAKSFGVGILLRSSNNIIGGWRDSSNHILHNMQGGILVDSCVHNRITHNSIFENDTADTHLGHFAIDLMRGGNDLKMAPVISGYKDVAQGKYLLEGTAIANDTIHVYRTVGAYESTRYFVDKTLTDGSGFWSLNLDVKDTVQFEKLKLRETLTFAATATDSSNNTSGVSNMLYLDTCYINNNKDNGNNVRPTPQSLRQCVVCGNSMKKRAEMRVSVSSYKAKVYLDAELPDFTNSAGFYFDGKNISGDKQNLIISNGYNKKFPEIQTLWTISPSVDSLKLRRMEFSNADTALWVMAPRKAELSDMKFSTINAKALVMAPGQDYSLTKLSFDQMSNATAVQLTGGSNVVINNLLIKIAHIALDIKNSKNISIMNDTISLSDTILYSKENVNLTLNNNLFKVGGGSKNILWDRNSGSISNNTFEMDRESMPVQISNSADLIVKKNKLKGTCDTCFLISNSSKVLFDANEIDKARYSAFRFDKSNNCTLFKNSVNSIDSIGIEVIASKNIKISQNSVLIDSTSLKWKPDSTVTYTKTGADSTKKITRFIKFDDRALTIDLHLTVPALVSNGGKVAPVITGYDVIRLDTLSTTCISDKTRFGLYLVGKGTTGDTIEVFFTDKYVDELQSYVAKGAVNSVGAWSILIPREVYKKPDEGKDYHFIVTGTDTLNNSSQASAAFHIDEVLRKFFVDNGNDKGNGSLRNAIDQINCSDVRNQVIFRFPPDRKPCEIVLIDSVPPINAYLGFEMDGATQFKYALSQHTDTLLTNNLIVINGQGYKGSILFDILPKTESSIIRNLSIVKTQLPIKLQNNENKIDSLAIVFDPSVKADATSTTSQVAYGKIGIDFNGANGNTINKVAISGYDKGVLFHKSASGNSISNGDFMNDNIAVMMLDSAKENLIKNNTIAFNKTGVVLDGLQDRNTIDGNTFGTTAQPITGTAIWVDSCNLQKIMRNRMPYGVNSLTDSVKAFIDITGESSNLAIADNTIGLQADSTFAGAYSSMVGIRLRGDSIKRMHDNTIYRNTIAGLTHPAIYLENVTNSQVTTNNLGVDPNFKTKVNKNDYISVPGIKNSSALVLNKTSLMTVTGNAIVNFEKHGIDVLRSSKVILEQNRIFSENSSLKGINLNQVKGLVSNDSIIRPVIDSSEVKDVSTIVISGKSNYPLANITLYDSFTKDKQHALNYLRSTTTTANGDWSITMPTENFGFSKYSRFVAQVTDKGASSEFSNQFTVVPLLCVLNDKIKILDSLYTPCPESKFTLDAALEGLNYKWAASKGEFDTIRTQIAPIDTSATVQLIISESASEQRCTHIENFKVRYKTLPKRPDFLVSTNTYVGDTLVVVDVSQNLDLPKSDNFYEWKLSVGVDSIPNQGKYVVGPGTNPKLYPSASVLRFVVPEPKTITVWNISKLNGCFVEQMREISVIYKDPSIKNPYELVPKFNQLEVYPNPVKSGDNINAFITTSTKDEIMISILTLEGKEVYYEMRQGKTNYHIEMPTGELKGIYLVTVTLPNLVLTKKILIQ